MYHALLAGPVAGLPAVHVEAAMLAQHMAWLHAHGYQVLTVAAWHRQRQAGAWPAKAVVLTFDDGYRSLVERAAPILRQYGFAATLFLTTDFVGQPAFPTAFSQGAPPHDPPLTWAEVRALQAAGWDIQAHSCTHRPHAALPAAQLKAELEASRQRIVEELGSAVDFYAFPYGSYSRHVLRALRAAGYQAGFAVHGGLATPASDPRRLPRLEINTSCTLPVFEQLVRTGYASPAAHYRARLRDALFHFPVVKDGLRKVFGGLVN